MSHPDSRVAGQIFAALGYPEKTCATVKLSPEDQHYFSKDYPAVFIPLKGAWGRRGATTGHLKAASKHVMSKAIQAAGVTLHPSGGWSSSRGLRARIRSLHNRNLAFAPIPHQNQNHAD